MRNGTLSLMAATYLPSTTAYIHSCSYGRWATNVSFSFYPNDFSKPSSRCYALHTFPSLFLLDISVHFYICPYDRFIAKTFFPSFLDNFLHPTYHIRTTFHTPLISSQRLPTPIPHLLQPYAPIGKPPFPHPSVFVRSFSPKAKSRCQPLYYRYKPPIW